MRPVDKSLRLINDLDRDFEVILERLSGVWMEGFHAAFDINRARSAVRFEVQPPLEDDAEERPAAIQAVPAEHGAVGHALESAELVNNEVLE